jgi:Mrp family chromosome partitioning ATPase
VAQQAVKSSGLTDRSAGELLGSSSVTPSPQADLLLFTVRDVSPAAAMTLANAYAAAYVDTQLRLDTAALQTARNELSGRINALRASGRQDTVLYRNLVANEQQLHTMQLLQSKDSVLAQAQLGAQVKPTPKHDAMLGFGFGLILGIAAAFILEALDTKIRSEAEIESELELPMLARLPEPSRRLRGNHVAMIEEPTSVFADAVRRLATNLEFSSPDRPSQTVMITSAVQREGKSTAASNLAVALARAGRTVALVDLDLREPTIASFFKLRRLVGLTNVVMQQATLDDALVPIDLSGAEPGRPAGVLGGTSVTGSLSVLPSGPLPATPGEFVASKAVVTRVLEPLRESFDHVILDTPPMSVGVDAASLAMQADSLIVVARLGVVDRTALDDLKRQLSTSPAHPIGFVLTGGDVRAIEGYGTYMTGRETRPDLKPPPDEETLEQARSPRRAHS